MIIFKILTPLNMTTSKIFFCISLCVIVTINAQTPNDINTGTQGSIQTHTGSQIGIYGNLNNDGSFTQNGGEVGFYNQTTIQTISGINTPQFYDFIVAVPNDLNLEVATDVGFAINFSNGRVITPRDTPNISLNLVDTDIYFDENDNRHVDGYTSYTGDNAYTFPVGDEFRLRTVSIEPNGAINTSKAAYFFENPNSPSTFSGFDTTETDETIKIVSTHEFWDLDGDIPTKATLTWDVMSNINTFISNNDFRELRVVGWSIEEDRWVDLGNTSLDGSNANSTNVNGSITSSFFIPNEYEVITFGGINQGVLPVSDGIEVLNAVSADGNDQNPYFRIIGINEFPNNNLKIYNRWGVIVFEMDGYTEPMPEFGDELDNTKVFMGRSNGRATVTVKENLPTGTYFYILNYELNGFGEKSKAGYLYLQN